MKILFIGSNPQNIGGIETFGRNLKKIYEDNISFFSYENNSKKLYDVENVFCYKKRKYHPKFLRKKIQKYIEKKHLKNLIMKINPDILILNSPQDLKKIEKFKQKKILIQHRNPKQYWETDSYFNKEEKLLEKVRKEIDLIVTLSPYDNKEFIEMFKLDKSKVKTIRHMSEISLLKKSKKKSKKLIIISRLVDSKRIDLAIKAMKKLSDYKLVIYGEGSSRKKLEALMVEKKINNVEFKGTTSRVQEKLDENAIFIMTSEHEGYAITNIEAMKRGLPILLRDTFTSAKDIINENGILLRKEWDEDEFIFAIKEIYENYEFYSKGSLIQGKRHSLEVIGNEWYKLL